MKSRLTHPVSQVVLTLIVLVAFSIACSASRSATSPAQPTNTASVDQSSSAPVSSSGQEKAACTLNMTQAPSIKGLKVGMTTDEVLAVFPGSKDDPEVRKYLSQPPTQFGGSELAIKPEKYENKAEFSNISRITFSLLDGRVSLVSLHYNGPAWEHVDKFVEKVAAEANLPAAQHWDAYVGQETQLKTLTCADFSVRVNAAGEGGNLNYVSMRDLEAEKKLKERRRKAREQASPTPGKQ